MSPAPVATSKRLSRALESAGTSARISRHRAAVLKLRALMRVRPSSAWLTRPGSRPD